jgi:2-polyprenyl-6-methoxyphenol hydroxylase-like FAD-dependent oxidoreductase
VGHSYPYSGDHSSFTVECDSGTWARAGFDSMSEEESRAYCEKVFAADLEGHEFLSNKSVWSNFVVNATERWWTGNVAVIGDAARTIHFSIGSGTRSAMEDAIWLASSIEPDRPLEASLKEYEARRGEASRRLLEVAERSYTWYEEFPSHMPLAPWDFAYSYMTRSGHVTEAGMMKRSPKFYAEYRASR